MFRWILIGMLVTGCALEVEVPEGVNRVCGPGLPCWVGEVCVALESGDACLGGCRSGCPCCVRNQGVMRCVERMSDCEALAESRSNP